MGKIFISYARSDDEPFVEKLYRDLTKRGFDVWWDREAMESRGRTFLQELRDAIENSDRVIAVIGPNAVKSEYVLVEWEHALLFSKCVVPVLRLGIMDLIPKDMKKLHCPDFRTQRPYKIALSELLRILAEPIPPLGLFRTIVPSFPPYFLSCPEEIASLGEVVLADVHHPVTVPYAKQVTAITGMGGIGKSVLASAFARTTETRRSFVDGVIWLSIGQMPTLVSIMRQIGLAFGGESKNYVDEQTAQANLPRVLADKACLIVLDDVWDIVHIAPLIGSLGPRCRVIVTTRDRSIATAIGAQEHPLGTLSDEQALILFANWCNIEPVYLPSEAALVAKECGNLPFALALCGAMARDGTRWPDILDALKEADLSFADKQFLNYPYQNVLKSLKVSIDALEGEDPNAFKCYCELAVFPRETIPEATVVMLWLYKRNLKERDARKLITKMANKALLKLAGPEEAKNSVSLHDLQHDYLRAVTSDFKRLHTQLLDAYWEKSEGSWRRGPNDGYFFEHLIYHLIKAKRKTEVQLLLQDLNWIQAKLKATNAAALIADFNLYPKEWPEQEKIEAFSNFVKNQSHILQRNPTLTFQQAINQPNTSTVFLAAQSLLESGKILSAWFQWINKPQHNDAPAHSLTITGHIGRVCECAWSPDGNRILSASSDRTLKIWDADTGKELQTLKGHINWVNSCVWSPDGNRILSASSDRTLKIWDANTGKELQTLKGHTDNVSSCAWSPDGQRILSASWDRTLKIWDADSGKPLQTLAGHNGDVLSCAWSPDGQRILSASWDRTLKIWDANTGKTLQTIEGPTANFVSCAWSPDGNRILSASWGTALKICDAGTGKELQTLKGHSGAVVSCAWSPDGNRILSASSDNTLKIWDAMTAKDIQTPIRRTHAVFSCAWSPNGKLILSASDEGMLKIWDAYTGKESQTLRGHTGPVVSCARSPDGQRILSASWDGTLKIWDANTGKELQTLKGHNGEVSSCVWSPDGQRILSASWDRTLKIWNANTGKPLQTLRGHVGNVFSCDYSPDGQRILSASFDRMQVWDANTGKPLQTLAGHNGDIVSCAWSPDGQRILSASEDSALKIWDANTGKTLQTLNGHTRVVVSCVWSPDGQRILSASWDRTLKIWNSNTGKELKTLKLKKLTGPTATFVSCVWSPDGQRILSASEDSALKIWDADTGKGLQTLKGHTGAVDSCVWSPDGQRILSASWDKTLKAWDSQTGSELATFANPSASHFNSIEVMEDGGYKVLAGDSVGAVFILQLLGIEFKAPIVQAVFLYRFDRKTRDDKATVLCLWCGDRFAVTEEMGGTEIECQCCGKKLHLNLIPQIRR